MPPGQGEALRRIGPYHIERRLGGGMGVVYLGRHHDSGAAVAVKVIKPEYAADRQFRARLRREVAAARRVPRFCTAPVVGRLKVWVDFDEGWAGEWCDIVRDLQPASAAE